MGPHPGARTPVVGPQELVGAPRAGSHEDRRRPRRKQRPSATVADPPDQVRSRCRGADRRRWIAAPFAGIPRPRRSSMLQRSLDATLGGGGARKGSRGPIAVRRWFSTSPGRDPARAPHGAVSMKEFVDSRRRKHSPRARAAMSAQEYLDKHAIAKKVENAVNAVGEGLRGRLPSVRRVRGALGAAGGTRGPSGRVPRSAPGGWGLPTPPRRRLPPQSRPSPTSRWRSWRRSCSRCRSPRSPR